MPEMSIKLPGGAEVPIPTWTRTAFGVIAVVAISFGVYRYFNPLEPELVTVQQANNMLRLEIAEYNKHIVDVPIVTLEEPTNALRVQAYEDGCLLVRRRFAGSATTRLLMDPNREDLKALGNRSALSLVPPVFAAMQPGRCADPHPGRFTFKYGEKDARDTCWVQVIRTFEDGCEHVQMFNVCTNSWATNQDGSPQIRWTRCLH